VYLFPKHNNKYKSYNINYISVVHIIILLIGVSMPSWVKWCSLYSIFLYWRLQIQTRCNCRLYIKQLTSIYDECIRYIWIIRIRWKL